MADPNIVNSNLWRLVNTDDNFLPVNIYNKYIPLPTVNEVGGVRPDGTSILISQTGVISSIGSGGIGLSVPYIAFTSSATPSSGQAFTSVNLAIYNNDPTRATVVVNGAVLTPTTSYTILGNVLTILDYLPASSTVHVQSTAITGGGGSGVTQITAGVNVSISPISGTGNVTVSVPNIVTQLLAGPNITLSPVGGTGAVTVSASGGIPGATTLQGLTDVSIVEPTYTATGLTVSTINGNIITTTAAVGSSVVVGDYIRGTNASPNLPLSYVTSVSGQSITVTDITNLGVVAAGFLYKASSSSLDQRSLSFDISTNKWVAVSPSVGITNLKQLYDVAVTEPSYVDSTLTISSFTGTSITTVTAVGVNVLVGDFIRGDNVSPNAPYTKVTAVSGSVITVGTTTGLGFVIGTGKIYKASSTVIDQQFLIYDLATNKWIPSPRSFVTSVDLTAPSEFGVSGRPITTSGTIAITKAVQAPNTVWAGPVSGSTSVAPTFRALTSADLPTPTISYDSSVTTFVPSGSTTTTAGATGATTFTSVGTFSVADRIAFRNVFNAQVYTINAVNSSTYTFTPALLAVDDFVSGAVIFSVTGTLTQTPITDIALGANLTGSLYGSQLTITGPPSTTVPSFTSVATIPVGAIFMGDPFDGFDVVPGGVLTIGGGSTFSGWVTSALPAGLGSNVVYNGSIYAAAGVNTAISSTDAVSWTVRTFSGTPSGGIGNFTTPILYNTNTFVIPTGIQVLSTAVWTYRYSADGITWSTGTTPIFSAASMGFGWARTIQPFGNNIVAVSVWGTATTLIIESSLSTSITAWDTVNTQTITTADRSITTIVGNGTAFVITTQTTTALTSTNGSSWAITTLPAAPIGFASGPPGSNFAPNMTVVNGLFIYQSSATLGYSSTDGITWNAFATPSRMVSISFGNNQYLVVGIDGRTFTAPTLSAVSNWTTVSQLRIIGIPIYGNGKWFSVEGFTQYNYTTGIPTVINVYSLPANPLATPSFLPVPAGTYRSLGGVSAFQGTTVTGLWKRET